MSIKEIKQEIEKFIDFAFGGGFYDKEDIKRHVFEDMLDFEPLEKQIEELIEQAEADEETIADYEKATYFEVENLREEQIVGRFGELFAKKDYRLLEAMLENYDLL